VEWSRREEKGEERAQHNLASKLMIILLYLLYIVFVVSLSFKKLISPHPALMFYPASKPQRKNSNPFHECTQRYLA
jgi:hypothetical protein